MAGRTTNRAQLIRLARVTGDLGELVTERHDPEIRQALRLMKAVLSRAAGEIAAHVPAVEGEG